MQIKLMTATVYVMNIYVNQEVSHNSYLQTAYLSSYVRQARWIIGHICKY